MSAVDKRAFDHVLDLGCGLTQEFLRHAAPYIYTGIDRMVEPSFIEQGIRRKKFTRNVFDADYRNVDVTIGIARAAGCTSVVSLFSTEITGCLSENTNLYERLMTESFVRTIMVSGFYYAGLCGQETVSETCGISYQSIAPIEKAESSIYDEMRVVIPCPSKLFGDDVVEVWRLLTSSCPE